MEIFPGTKLAGENPSGEADLSTLSEQLPVDARQLDVTDPGWRNVLQPPDAEAPYGYGEETTEEVVEVLGSAFPS